MNNTSLTAHIDGGMNGIGVVLRGSGQTVRISKTLGRRDNNMAEYLALLEALQYAESINATKLHVYSDSDVVVRQMDGRYRCRSPRLHSLNFVCRKLARSLDFSIEHISRDQNTEAHGLAGKLSKLPITAREEISPEDRW